MAPTCGIARLAGLPVDLQPRMGREDDLAALESGSEKNGPNDGRDVTYELVGFVSHIGKNTGSGHYVAHIKKDGRWVIFDDQKVALSAEPPRRRHRAPTKPPGSSSASPRS